MSEGIEGRLRDGVLGAKPKEAKLTASSNLQVRRSQV